MLRRRAKGGPIRRLKPTLDPERFFARVSRAAERVLLLDFDGTLAPFERDPGRVRPFPGVAGLLDDIMAARESRVVLVTGRSLDGVPSLGTKRRPEIWAAHGWQRWTPQGGAVEFPLPPGALGRLAEAEAHARSLGEWGARVERKPASVAVHWRGLHVLAADAIRESLRRGWAAVAQAPALEAIEFDCGVELRVATRNKGSVVDAVLDATGPGTVSAYLGDDLTDEDAFRAIEGRGLGVLVRPVVRHTRADAWLRPPAEVRAFLARWRDCVGARR